MDDYVYVAELKIGKGEWLCASILDIPPFCCSKDEADMMLRCADANNMYLAKLGGATEFRMAKYVRVEE